MHFSGHLLYLEEKYGDLGANEVRRLRQLYDKNARFKGLEADLTLDKNILLEVLKKLKLAKRHELGVDLVNQRISD